MKKESLEKIIKYAHKIEINMNDTFHYACGDSSHLPSEDVWDLLPFMALYDFDTLIAYEAIKRDYDPEIEDYLTLSYFEIKNILIEKMKLDENFLCDLNHQKRREKKEIEEFGGKLYFRWEKPTNPEIKNGLISYICECHCEGRTEVGYGKNMNEAQIDLKSKIEGLK